MARRKPQQGKPDGNQQGIIDGLEALGYSVQRLQSVGNGCPDLLVGRGGNNWLIEVKMPGCVLNEAQRDWMKSWRGQAAVARSLEDCLHIITTNGSMGR